MKRTNSLPPELMHSPLSIEAKSERMNNPPQNLIQLAHQMYDAKRIPGGLANKVNLHK